MLEQSLLLHVLLQFGVGNRYPSGDELVVALEDVKFTLASIPGQLT